MMGVRSIDSCFDGSKSGLGVVLMPDRRLEMDHGSQQFGRDPAARPEGCTMGVRSINSYFYGSKDRSRVVLITDLRLETALVPPLCGRGSAVSD